MNKKYVILENTTGIIEVNCYDFAKAIMYNKTRSYNKCEVIFFEDYLAISNPAPPSFYGEHWTLVLPIEQLESEFTNASSFPNSKTIKEYFADLIYFIYLYMYEEWVRKDEQYEIGKKIEKVFKEIKQ